MHVHEENDINPCLQIPTEFNTQIFEKLIWVLKFVCFHVYGCFDRRYINTLHA